MHRIACQFEWDMAHRLPGHAGQCRNLHGHRYRAEVMFSAETLTPEGFVIDFAVAKKRLKAWVDEHWDHTTVYQTGDLYMQALRAAHFQQPGSDVMKPWFAMTASPTAENLARLLYEKARQLITEEGVVVECVRLYETPTSFAEWSD